MKHFFLIATFMMMLVIASPGQSYRVIVNKNNSITSINKSELSDIFYKKSSEFSNGSKVTPVDQKASSAVRKSFTSEVHGKSVTAIKSFWQQSVFQGKSTPPIEKSQDEAVVEYVANNPGAIGYVSSSADVSSVKTISIN